MGFIEILKRIIGCKEEELLRENAELKRQIEAYKADIGALKNLKGIEEPKSMGKIEFRDAFLLLQNNLPGASIFISDEYLNLTTKDEARIFSDKTKVQYRQWKKEDHDCDNFSFAAMGYWSQGLESFAYGIAWSAGHAFNIMIDKDKQIWIIEPQTNKYITIEEARKNINYYPMRLVLM